jgi:MoxR-like ATPase
MSMTTDPADLAAEAMMADLTGSTPDTPKNTAKGKSRTGRTNTKGAPANGKGKGKSKGNLDTAVAVIGAAEDAVSGTVVRPGGQTYYTRAVAAGLNDVQMYRRAQQQGLNILLFGPPGTGKTSALEAAFGDGIVTVEGNGDTEVRDLIGGYVQKVGAPELQQAREAGVQILDEAQALVLAVTGQMTGKQVVVCGTPSSADTVEKLHAAGAQLTPFFDNAAAYVVACGSAMDKFFEWENGPAVIAAEQDKVLFIDDFTKIMPVVLTKLFPLMDDRRMIRLEQKVGGTEVKAGPNFIVVGAHNPGAPQAVLEEAMAARFGLHAHVSSDFRLARKLGVDPRVVSVAERMRNDHEAKLVKWAPQMRELLAFQKVADEFGAEFAARNMIASAPENERAALHSELSKHFNGLPAHLDGMLALRD